LNQPPPLPATPAVVATAAADPDRSLHLYIRYRRRMATTASSHLDFEKCGACFSSAKITHPHLLPSKLLS
jgi:hypothetical protein